MGRFQGFFSRFEGSWLVNHCWGYKHGRVLEATSDHEHLIDVALALELSPGTTATTAHPGTTAQCTILELFYIFFVKLQVLWVSIVTLMILLKRRQKSLQRRELAESIEDAKIFASSRQLDHTQNIMMQPLDQVRYV